MKDIGLKFRRQHTIDRFILDFNCSEASLVIEVEGSIHQYTQEHDAIRREYLETIGLKVLRISNDEIKTNVDNVMEKIATAVKERMVDRDKAVISASRIYGAIHESDQIRLGNSQK